MGANNRPRANRWLAFLTMALAAVGIPMSTLAIFKNEISTSPMSAISILVVYELSLVFFGFARKIWQQLEVRWVKRVADWLDLALVSFLRSLLSRFSGYRRSYLKWLFYQNRDLDVKGLTTQGVYNLQLNQVFVDLMLDPKPPHAISPDPIRGTTKASVSRAQIWHYLESEAIGDENIALIGPPGSGKTTLLKNIALQMAGNSRPKISQALPIVIYLREQVDSITKNPSYSLAAAAEDTLARKQGPVPPSGWFDMKLRRGRCLVLLDGLDEVAVEEARIGVVGWVERQIKGLPGNRFIVTSRPYGYRSNPIEGMSVLEVQPFTRDQIRRFVLSWYRANEIRASGTLDPGVEMKAREGAEDLLRRLVSTPLNDLAVNPLLLTMIATVHRFRSSLPGRRVELYSEICEVFLGKRQQARGLEAELTPAQKQRVLQPLAYALMCSKVRELALEDCMRAISQPLRRVGGRPGDSKVAAGFLKAIEESSGLLLEREANIYGFSHLAFQEFLAAVHIREQGLAADLKMKIADPWWQEAIRLYGAQGDASPILEACLTTDSPTVPALTLAIDCLEEAREIDPNWRERVESLLARSVEDAGSGHFALAAETMLARRLRDMPSVDENTFVDSRYITQAEYQLFLNSMRVAGRCFQPDHWKADRFSAGQSMFPVLGVRSSDAAEFCQWLGARFSSWTFRLPRFAELGGYGVSGIAPAVPVVANYWVESEEGALLENEGSCGVLSHSYVASLMERDLSLHQRRSTERTLRRALGAPIVNEAIHAIEAARDCARRLAFDDKIIHAIGGYSFNAWPFDISRHCSIVDRVIDCGNGSPSLSFRVVPGRSILSGDLVPLNRHVAAGPTEPIVLDIKNRLGRARVKYKRMTAHLDSSLFEALNLIVAVVLGRACNDQPEVGSLLRWAGRVLALDIWKFTEAGVRADALKLFSGLCLLEARIDGEIQCVEGIRIVKERRP